MTEKELIAITNANQEKINALTNEIDNLKSDTKKLVEDYIKDNSKYKVGDVVNYIIERYKTPRRYIVKDVWGCINQQNNGTKVLTIYYRIQTANGFKPNRGWSIVEQELKPAE